MLVPTSAGGRVWIGALAAVLLTAGTCTGIITTERFFGSSGSTVVPFPPQDRLLLWVEGGSPHGDPFLLGRTGKVRAWSDRRGGSSGFLGVVTTRGHNGEIDDFYQGERVELPTAGGVLRTAWALRCGDRDRSEVRCSYSVSGPTIPLLDETPYSILAVVRRNSGRGDNYFVMTGGKDCRAYAGGTGCESNTALHLGWSGERTTRLGQYDNDVWLGEVPAYDSREGRQSLFVGMAGPATKTVALLEPRFNRAAFRPDTTLLRNSGALFVGGTPFPEYALPDWRFVGDIFALLIYTKELSPRELDRAQAYLRQRYGPA